ncbi:hypothetical protein LOTGIDRAFT_233123 [Lottia gigantea]|uniref:Transmembrane protein 234 n=1 Tax=Lottia gigantea TaxID=225164 RepID=V4AG28_LOTGI|nr:hypothetical protein LOTGIDRAFT_233123 [Lottia gigantea]ESO92351.1 hypothetical protein LOTGIDRAFT_233123 [Lottia gigantea]
MIGNAEQLENAVWLLCVAALWGGTNPFIRQGSKGIENIKKDNAIKQFLYELVFLFTNLKYLIPFVLNQCGSILFYITLSSADLSLAVPITNSLTFIFTSISGKLLGEHIGSKETYIGMVMVIIGVSLCVISKL